MRRRAALLLAALLVLGLTAVPSSPAWSSPVCTDGFMGGPPRTACGGRIFPEAARANSYVQVNRNPATSQQEYLHGLMYLAQLYPRWISVFTFRDHFQDAAAATVGRDGRRAGAPGDTGDGRDILVIKITDHEAPDAGKETLFFSLSVHGNERGGLEGGLRTAEDLALAATDGGTIVDGVDNYTTTTGFQRDAAGLRVPAAEAPIHEYEVADVLRQEAVYLVDFNIDGWEIGDYVTVPTAPYRRGNGLSTDLNRQMQTIGRINASRNPLQENEARFGVALMNEISRLGRQGRAAYGADVHGEITSRAYMDIMYPAGQFDSVKHRQLMSIAERTKSVIDATLYDGIVDEIEEGSGGNDTEGVEDELPPGTVRDNAGNVITTKPAHWATVWDTLGYTDTGFIGDYLASDEVSVTGMDYEIFLNHTVPDKTWNVYLQENHINATRGIIKTAMAYAITQSQEFNEQNVAVDTVGRAGYVVNPDTVTDTDEDGIGTLPGPKKDGIGADGQPVVQAPYEVSNQEWFRATGRLMGDKPFVPLGAFEIAEDPAYLDAVDTLVLADVALPADAQGRAVDADAYYANLNAWVRRGGNLVLTDRALHALDELDVFADGPTPVTDVKVYQPYADVVDLAHPLVAGLRANGRQLVEAPVLGYGIGNSASPMTIVDQAAWEAAGGVTVGTTNNADGIAFPADPERTSLGFLELGDGQVQIVGGALPTPTEVNDHRFGLRDFALTYSGLYVMENAIAYDAPNLGNSPVPPPPVDPDPVPTDPPTTPPTPPPPAPAPGEPVTRLAGPDRVASAAAVSAATFAPGVARAYVATGEAFPDALAGGPAAALSSAPVLLVGRDNLPQPTADELTRLRPGEIVLLGGEQAVSPAVEVLLRDYADGPVTRVAGMDRFATAAAVSAATFAPGADIAYVATGATFPDALAGGAAAAAADSPVLLVGPDQLPTSTREELERLRPGRIAVLGGVGAVSDGVRIALEDLTEGTVTRVAGDDRYDTAAAVSAFAFADGADTAFIATGGAFPDALSAVPAAAQAEAPVLLVRGTDVPERTGAELTRLGAERVVIVGGTAAVAQSVEDDLRSRLGG